MNAFECSVKTTNSVDANVGQSIRRRRLALKIPTSAIAKRLGVSVQQLHKYEKGLNRVPAGRLHLISVMLDLPVSRFFDVSALSAAEDKEDTRPDAFLRNNDARRLSAAFLRIPEADIRRAVFLIIEAIADGEGGAPSQPASTHAPLEQVAKLAPD